MEAALDFDPPLVKPTEWDHIFSGEYQSIGWNAGAQIDNPIDELFEHRACDVCGWRPPTRTGVELKVTDSLRGTDGCCVFERANDYAGPRLLIVSEHLLSLLTKAEKAQFATRRVQRGRGSVRRFYEIIPHEVIETVSIAGFEASGWRCAVCDYSTFSNAATFGWRTDLIARTTFDAAPSGLFILSMNRPSLCLPAHRVRALIDAGVRQISRGRIGVVADQQCDSAPALRERKSFNTPTYRAYRQKWKIR